MTTSDGISNTDGLELSVLIPLLDEQDNLEPLAHRLVASLDSGADSYELIFIDDGSTDASVDVIRSIARRHEPGRIRLIPLARNFGKEAAMLAGYDHALGRAVVVLDADLQQPPELLPEMLGLWRLGYDVVHAERMDVAGVSRLRRAASSAFYWVQSGLMGVAPNPRAADFRLLDRAVVETLRSCREAHRFNRALVAWAGFRQVAVPYHAARRHAGTAKWSTRRLLAYALDGILSFSVRPLRWMAAAGALVSSLSFVYLIVVVVLRIVRPELAGAHFGYASIIGLIALLGGCQLLCAGLLGEYVGRIYEQVKGRPAYVVRMRDHEPEPPGHRRADDAHHHLAPGPHDRRMAVPVLPFDSEPSSLVHPPFRSQTSSSA
jgi:dolichol-phosphate mannosyltransferase